MKINSFGKRFQFCFRKKEKCWRNDGKEISTHRFHHQLEAPPPHPNRFQQSLCERLEQLKIPYMSTTMLFVTKPQKVLFSAFPTDQIDENDDEDGAEEEEEKVEEVETAAKRTVWKSTLQRHQQQLPAYKYLFYDGSPCNRPIFYVCCCHVTKNNKIKKSPKIVENSKWFSHRFHSITTIEQTSWAATSNRLPFDWVSFHCWMLDGCRLLLIFAVGEDAGRKIVFSI